MTEHPFRVIVHSQRFISDLKPKKCGNGADESSFV